MERLRNLRKSRDKSQKDVADYINKTFQAYSMYENGKREPDHETLKKLAEYFNVTVDYLLGLGEQPTFNKPIELKKILDQNFVAFDGNLISEQDKIFIMQMLSKMYPQSKQN